STLCGRTRTLSAVMVSPLSSCLVLSTCLLLYDRFNDCFDRPDDLLQGLSVSQSCCRYDRLLEFGVSDEDVIEPVLLDSRHRLAQLGQELPRLLRPPPCQPFRPGQVHFHPCHPSLLDSSLRYPRGRSGAASWLPALRSRHRSALWPDQFQHLWPETPSAPHRLASRRSGQR